MITENTAKMVGGTYIPDRYIDMIKPKDPEEKIDGQEVADDIIGRIAGKK